MQTNGIHHITAISSSAQKTYDFYTKILGLRMIKKTINFDSPDTYHLYFANEKGDPGTVLTFFPFQNAGTGMRGAGQATKIMFSVPKKSLGFWIERFIKFHVKYEKISKHFGESSLIFYDFDGQQLQLIATDENSGIKSWTELIDKENAINSFYGVELTSAIGDATGAFLENILGYEKIKESQFITRYQSKTGSYAKYIDVFEMKAWPRGRMGAGTIHHIAFRVADNKKHEAFLEFLRSKDMPSTDIIDRKYFKSIYLNEPNGVIIEIATDGPGFDVDEELAHLGERLSLPEWLESGRKKIEEYLPEIITN